MTRTEFRRLRNPSIQQCLEYLHIEIKYPLLASRILKVRIERIPEKHREFCKIQLKLEGLL